MLIGLLSLVFIMGTETVRAVDLIDVVEIIDPAPFIIHTNILPGDTFMDKMTVRNLTSSPQEVLMNLDIDLSEGIVNIIPFELEEKLTTRIERVGSGDITLPGGGTTKKLQELDDTLINLGTIAGNSEQEYWIHVVFDANAGNEYQNTKVYFNITMGLEIADLRGSLRLVKTNDSVSDEFPGNEVVYTLEVTALGGDVDDVTVTDLPPEGFAYVAGTGEGAPFIHEYASPGIWELGDMEEGETRTLTYRTRISDAQDAGLYRDLAFARGVAVGTPIFANSAENPFVGTAVNVILGEGSTVVIPRDDENKIKEKVVKKIKYVLGASTLPLTGANVAVVMAAVVGLVLGAVMIVRGQRQRHQISVGIIIFAGMLSVFLGAESARAATLSVQIETPEAVMATPNFKIGFVTLDVLGRALTVECYKDADVVPYASYALASAFGGNSGNCQVDSSVLSADGSYEFFVRAVASDEGSETVESAHVMVTLASSVPGAPHSYNRNDTSCQNIITFTTADDGGKTVKVELFRSFSTTFTADASTKVAEQAIGSNVAGSFTQPAPECSNDAFYALRAVDAFGHGSSFVGDKDVHVDTRTVQTTRTTTATLPGGTATTSGAIPVTSDGAGAAVQGATTSDEAVAGAESEEAEGAVLGEATEESMGTVEEVSAWMEEHPWQAAVAVFVGLMLGYYAYQLYRRKHDQSTD